jgi:hypothetical protein
MVDATRIVTNGLWTSGEGETVYITQLEVEVSLDDIEIEVELE